MSLITIADRERLSHTAPIGPPLSPFLGRHLWPLAVPIALLAIWELLAHASVADPRFLPPLEEVVARGVAEFSRGGLAFNLLASLERDLIGFVCGSVAGIALGLAIGFSRLLERLLGPVLLVHRQIALFAWVPLISMWFGGGEAGKVVFIALAAFQPALINTWQGVSGIPRSYRELAEVLTFGWFDFARIIAIPGALPQIFTGLHSALIYAWTATVGAELLLNIAPGIGGRMNEGQHLFHMDLLLLCILLLGGVGVVFNVIAGSLEHRLLRWRIA
ncbi:MAG: ABC transporter permease [Mesorhizobium sp.]|uniref:ABC transporter permease n=1 Tax=Mesorhizobium sp. TaxID=1871066 RepID=UPI000FE6DD22|nr:ABC transporter permease [Mesorhizobium sp.]RWG13201.1 MAG: ABC transporter permease [Mesorhizobium sp.]